ncbi:MAG TPA: hypothetical protein VGG64_12705 [Pirellulales bacterium]|jgi:hypothetical protein
MALDSSSTYDDAIAAYQDNASYEELEDVAKCRAFISACRFLMSFPNNVNAGDGQSFTVDVSRVQAQLEQARIWAADHSRRSGTGSRTFDLRNFRGPGGGW